MNINSFVPWLYLFIASVMEILWLLSLKFLDIKDIRKISWNQLFANLSVLNPLVPLSAYILTGFLNIVFFSMATKQIPFATAFAIWMGTALMGSLLIDVFFFKENYNLSQFVFFIMILIGVIGLKISAS